MLAMRRENDQIFGNATNGLNGGSGGGGMDGANELSDDCNGYQSGMWLQTLISQS